jgi:hypothetical protein
MFNTSEQRAALVVSPRPAGCMTDIDRPCPESGGRTVLTHTLDRDTKHCVLQSTLQDILARPSYQQWTASPYLQRPQLHIAVYHACQVLTRRGPRITRRKLNNDLPNRPSKLGIIY